MNKMMLASLSVLLAGATALPAMADDNGRRAGGEQSWQDGGRQDDKGNKGGKGDKGRYSEDGRGQRPDNRGNRPGNQEARQDWQSENRAPRQDPRAGNRGGHDQYARNDYARNDHRRDDDRRGDTRHYDDRRYDHRYDGRHDNRYRDYRGGHGNYVRHHDRRWNGNHWYPQYRYRAPVRYVYPPGYRSYHWRVGHRLPPAYYGRPYWVDYRPYRLPPPPYGYGWVRVDQDVVLVALATGLILDVLYGVYY